ncbi:MobQ family relaxase [Pseudomonas graminis]|uniref:MobQ family relaxase n=1 Tax=Pseudomonas graminis TaxID=158627 RepID=UPI00234BD049|nr:MobQ family relaxase [Pseudomonas graminis]MDC6383694.1 MobQ family relaxase [Pseudomonas graminis]
MALYSVSVKTVGRSSGRSSTAAAAYRNAERLVNERTGEVHDYRRRSGVDFTAAFAPAGIAPIPSSILWNRAEAAEVRKNANVAREVLVALPHELDQVQRQALAKAIAQELANRYGTAGTLAIHRPDREGDQRNHHVHILMTTRRVDVDGQLGEKTRELDDLKQRGPLEVQWIREMIETRTNHALENAGSDSRVDRRSLAEQQRAALVAGNVERAAQLDRPATIHEGPRVTQIRREAARAGRAPLGALDRAAVNDDVHQLVAQRVELARISAQILDFETARLVRDRADAFLAGVPRGDAYTPQHTLHHLDKSALLAQLTTEKQADDTVLYRLNRDAAFTDTGKQRLAMAQGASASDDKVTAALLTAIDRYQGSIELNGTDAFKAKAIGLIVRHRIEVSMRTPEQQAMLDTARLDDIVMRADLEHERLLAGRPADDKPAQSEPLSTEQTIAQGVAAARARFEQQKQALQDRQASQDRRRSAERDQQRNDALRQQQYYAEEERRRLEAEQKAAAQSKWRPPSPG